jgi:hypothetical protein
MRNPAQLALVPLLAIGCASAPDEGIECTEDGKCDTLSATKLKVCKTAADFKTEDGSLACTPCGDVLADASGRGFIPSFTANDALIKKVYMTFEDTNANKKIDTAEITCPLDMPGIMAKLEKTDTKDCNGVATRVVSEDAAKLGADRANYRAVTSRDCEGRDQFGLLFSSFGFTGDPGAKGSGIHTTEAGHPGALEVIAFDETDGVFNYYKEVDGAMRFFGSSLDFVVAGPGGPELTSTRGCANCHPGGGLNMKELESPWTHWALEDNIAGSDTLVNSRTAYMGRLESGANMQFNVTQAGNDKWGASKAKLLSELTTANLTKARGKLADDRMSAAEKADLAKRQLKRGLNATQMMLEPLFCTVQVNINNSCGGSSIPGHMFASNRNGLRASGKSFSRTELDTALAAINSTVPDVGGTELTTPFMALEPSHEDESYLNALAQLGVLDQQLIQDVLMVDFTRPVMSDDRCALLGLVPDLTPANRKAAKIRDALIDAIQAESPAAGSPAAQLLLHLEANKAGTPRQHGTTLSTYAAKCQARDSKSMLRDALKLRSLQRKVAYNEVEDANEGVHPFLVFEFQPSMPADDVSVTDSAAPDSVTEVALGARWSPTDCTLVSEFVAVP